MATKDIETMRAQHMLLLRGIANRLEGELGEHFTRDTLTHYVEDTYDELASRSTVMTHLPAFVERFSRQRLRALAKNEGHVAGEVPEVLFVCQGNDARSQMAAALFRSRAGERAHVHSAGSMPAGDLREEAVHVLHELGIEMFTEFPKPIAPEIEQSVDVIVTLDAHDDIPVVEGKEYHAWRVADRHQDGLEGYRAMREEIAGKVDELAHAMFAPSGAGS